MQITLLSGGSGKRLWPLSNNARSKQFLPLLQSPSGDVESMVQRVVRQINESRLSGQITIATNSTQKDIIINQLGENIDIVTELDDSIIIEGDRELFLTVWLNLISNAVKFTESGGKITVTLKRQNGCAVVSVSDTGCGMTETTGRRIFEKFYQGDTSHTVEGNGLGLALVKRIIDITKSRITVESELGKSSCFTVYIKE